MARNNKHASVCTDNTRSSISVYRNLLWSWFKQPYNYPKRDRSHKHNRYYKYIPAVILSALFPSTSLAETVGGVSATASPVANSSGSVTNQAVQVLQGPYITNTYGSGIQCQGPTRNFTPYVTGSASASKPYEPYYMDPVYDVSDNFGAFDADGNEIGDGIIDNPGKILFRKKTRTGQKDNYSLGVGFSMTWSTPTDKKLQELCKTHKVKNIWMRPNPINENKFYIVNKIEKLKLRNKLTNFSNDDIVMTHIATFIKQKNHIFLLDVLKKLPEKYKLYLGGTVENNEHKINGILTIKNIAHPISFVLTFNDLGAFAKMTFDRSKYDVKYRSASFFSDLGDKLIYDDIDVEVTLIF